MAGLTIYVVHPVISSKWRIHNVNNLFAQTERRMCEFDEEDVEHFEDEKCCSNDGVYLFGCRIKRNPVL